jgi:hypothetical protein
MGNAFKALTLGALLVTPLVTPAAPVNYDESVSGDLSRTIKPSTLFNLGVGANRIAGDPGGSGDYDSFRFSVPSDAALSLIRLTFDVTPVSGEVSLGTDHALYVVDPLTGEPPPPGARFALSAVDLLNGSRTQNLFEGALPLSSGHYFS